MDIQKMIGLDEFKDISFVRRLVAELIGTFLLMAILLSGLREDKSTLGHALANGLLLSSIVAYTGHISGGHVNPAVTVGMLVCDFIKLLPALCYIVVQILGAIFGELVAISLADLEKRDREDYSEGNSDFFLEVLQTFLLVSVAISVSDPKRHPRGIGSSALAIGLSRSASLSAVSDYKGSNNPAAALATSILLSSFKRHWVHWVGPLFGGLLAGIVYRFGINHKKPPSSGPAQLNLPNDDIDLDN